MAHCCVDRQTSALFLGGTDRQKPHRSAKKGTKRHLLVDGQGTPLAVRITGANRNESLEAMNLVDDIPPIRGRRGRPRRQAESPVRGPAVRHAAEWAGAQGAEVEDHLARQRTPHGSGLGKIRWVVERSLESVGNARRLKIRYDKLPSIHRAFHFLQLARICCTILVRDFC